MSDVVYIRSEKEARKTTFVFFLYGISVVLQYFSTF